MAENNLALAPWYQGDLGLTNMEVAQALGLSERTVKNHWTHARAWLFREIKARRH